MTNIVAHVYPSNNDLHSLQIKTQQNIEKKVEFNLNQGQNQTCLKTAWSLASNSMSILEPNNLTLNCKICL